MAKKYPGLYLYFDWLKGLVKLPPEVAMRIIENLYHYAEDGTEPEPLSDLHYDILQDMYMDQLKRTKRMEDSGRMGGYVKAANAAYKAASSRQIPSPYDLPIYDPEADKIIDQEIAQMIRKSRTTEDNSPHSGNPS